jgi:hypothetical protein
MYGDREVGDVFDGDGRDERNDRQPVWGDEHHDGSEPDAVPYDVGGGDGLRGDALGGCGSRDGDDDRDVAALERLRRPDVEHRADDVGGCGRHADDHFYGRV